MSSCYSSSRPTAVCREWILNAIVLPIISCQDKRLENVDRGRMSSNQDIKAHQLCVKSIERHSMDVQDWQHTVIAQMHDGLPGLQADELPIVSIYFSPLSWSVLTNRRVLGAYYSHKIEIDVSKISETNFGNFKGYGGKRVEVMTLRSLGSQEFRLEYETGKASMAPIYYFSFWKKKYPIIDKLVS